MTGELHHLLLNHSLIGAGLRRRKTLPMPSQLALSVVLIRRHIAAAF